MRADEASGAADAGTVRQNVPRVAPWAGTPGSEVSVEMSGLPGEVTFWVGAGALGAEQEILEEAETNTDGALAATVRVPSWARPDRELFFFVADTDSQPMAISPPFHVTAEDGTFRVEGRIADGGDCPVLRAENEETYTLEGDTPTLRSGDRVAVEGRVAREPRCRGERPIAVQRIERA